MQRQTVGILTQLDRRRHRIAAAVAAAAGLAVLASAQAQAQANTSALCTVTLPAASITPPFYPFVLAPASGTVTTGGPTGTVACVGDIDGAKVTGPGTVGLTYAYSHGSCAAHMGLGTVAWTIPTAAGPKQLTGTLTVRRIGLAVLAKASFPQALADLAGALVPIDGDCVLTPVREVSVVVAGPLVGT